MRLIISPVEYASVKVNNKKRSIDKWLLVYVWISKSDCNLNLDDINKKVEKVANKLCNLKLFSVDWKINASLKDINWQILIISNFTLYGKNKKWNKIDFLDSWDFSTSKKIYDLLVNKLKLLVNVKTWEFGEYMEVESKNNGPLNYVLEF